ncbi:MAG: hypothetical protein MH321_11670 [Leptospiraceae bacterium]|nr:hypothetical protein [Leptospiraceae bacterium]
MDLDLESGLDPRSKVLWNPESLEDWELLSLILGSGTRARSVYDLSKDILQKIGGLSNLASLSALEIQALPGLGKSRLGSLLAISQIAVRIQKQKLKNKIQYFPIYHLYQNLWMDSRPQIRESFYLASFGVDGRLLFWERIARGSLMEVGVHKRDIIQMLLQYPSKYSLIAHNHPGQSCQASWQDESLFQELSDILIELEIICIDHWVVGEDGLYSCRLRGCLETDSWTAENIPNEYKFLADI